MSTLAESTSFVSTVEDVVPTGAAREESFEGSSFDCAGQADAWRRLIDDTLVEWGRNPGCLEAEGIEPPSPAVVDYACRLAICLMDAKYPPPAKAVPDGDGGISLLWRQAAADVHLRCYDDGTVEWLVFRDGRLIDRMALPAA